MSKARGRTEYSRHYNSFLGLNLSENPSKISEMRLSDIENMYRDYDGEGEGITEATYEIAQYERYVRVAVTDENGGTAWSHLILV